MNILLITGYACTGKSTISKYICSQFSIDYVSFHDEMRRKSRENGFTKTRFYLEAIGIEAFLRVSSELLFTSIKRRHSILIDGIYNVNFLELLKSVGEKYTLIVIDALNPNRLSRMQKRESLSYEQAKIELELYDSIKDSFGIANVLKCADARINNDADINLAIEQLEEIIKNA